MQRVVEISHADLEPEIVLQNSAVEDAFVSNQPGCDGDKQSRKSSRGRRLWGPGATTKSIASPSRQKRKDCEGDGIEQD